MWFLTISLIRIGSLLLGIATAIFATANDCGYWALVLNTLITSICTIAEVWLVTGWRLDRPRRSTGVGPMLRHGANLLGFNVINYFPRNLDNILIGRSYGSVALGLYSKAYQLMMPIANICP